MIYLFPQKPDTIPFFLKREIVTTDVDTTPVNEFLSYQFLPLDSLNLSYNIDAFNREDVFAGLPAMVRPFLEQFGSLLFLVFVFCFVLTALVFRRNGRAFVSSLGLIFSLGNRNKSMLNESVTSSDAWGQIYFILQTLLLYSIFFFVIAVKQVALVSFINEYLQLFGLIFAGISLFVFIKYILYIAISALFLDTKTDDIIDTYLWILYLSGILTFFPLIAYIYIPEVQTYALMLIIGVFLLGRIIVFIKAYSLFVKSHIDILYYFVYLCGVEIMPYFIIYKAIMFIQ